MPNPTESDPRVEAAATLPTLPVKPFDRELWKQTKAAAQEDYNDPSIPPSERMVLDGMVNWVESALLAVDGKGGWVCDVCGSKINDDGVCVQSKYPLG